MVFPTIPPKVEYSMTPLGFSFVQSLNVVVHWAVDHVDEVLAAREAYEPPIAEPVG